VSSNVPILLFTELILLHVSPVPPANRDVNKGPTSRLEPLTYSLRMSSERKIQREYARYLAPLDFQNHHPYSARPARYIVWFG
jgi:hypothetical protein